MKNELYGFIRNINGITYTYDLKGRVICAKPFGDGKYSLHTGTAYIHVHDKVLNNFKSTL